VRWYLIWGPSIVVGALALAALIGLGFLIYRGAPIKYADDEYQPGQPIVNVGETLIYTPSLIIQHGGSIEFTRSFYTATKKGAVDCAGVPLGDIYAKKSYPQDFSGLVRDNTVKIAFLPIDTPLPPDGMSPNGIVYRHALPPGRYELSSTATGPTGGEASYIVWWEVTTPCPPAKP
jgi:hypothetical protein